MLSVETCLLICRSLIYLGAPKASTKATLWFLVLMKPSTITSRIMGCRLLEKEQWNVYITLRSQPLYPFNTAQLPIGPLIEIQAE